jgi:hypothetical protein
MGLLAFSDFKRTLHSIYFLWPKNCSIENAMKMSSLTAKNLVHYINGLPETFKTVKTEILKDCSGESIIWIRSFISTNLINKISAHEFEIRASSSVTVSGHFLGRNLHFRSYDNETFRPKGVML